MSAECHDCKVQPISVIQSCFALSLHPTVNYFSHYYFDHLPGEENHNFGLSLPDFVRNFLHGTKLKPILPLEIQESEYPMLLEGTHKHFVRDQVFHSSDFFKQTENQLNTILKPVFQSLNIARYWFAAHLFSEMMIDRVLMKNKPHFLDLYYQDLEAANMPAVLHFLKARGIENTEVFEDRILRFIKSEYLRQYVNDPALVYSLNRVFIYAKAGQEWTPDQYKEIQRTIPEIEAYITENMGVLIKEME